MSLVEFKIDKLSELKLIGVSGFSHNPYDGNPNLISKLWNIFSHLTEKYKKLLKQKIIFGKDYEFDIWNEKEQAEGKFKKSFVGVEVRDLSDIPIEFDIMIVPKSKYAVCKMQGKIPGVFKSPIDEKFPSDKHPRAMSGNHHWYFQLYTDEFQDGNSESSVLYHYLAIKE